MKNYILFLIPLFLIPIIPAFAPSQLENIILQESDWKDPIGYKWGYFGIGTGNNIEINKLHYFDGSSSVKMTSGDKIGDTGELKININHFIKGKTSFEQKWFLDSSTSQANMFDMGIENRIDIGLQQARVRYTQEWGEWKYLDSNANYQSFNPPAKVAHPSFDTSLKGAGDRWGWTKLTFDLDTNKYVSFEIAGRNGYVFYDMTNISPPNLGQYPIMNTITYFALVKPGTNQNAVGYTTDWIISEWNN